MKKIMLGGMMAALVMVLALAVAPARAETDEAAAVAFVRYVTDHAADINGDGTVKKVVEPYAGVGGKVVVKTTYYYYDEPACNRLFSEESEPEGSVMTAEMQVSAEFRETEDSDLEYQVIGVWIIVSRWERQGGRNTRQELRMLDLEGDLALSNVFFRELSRNRGSADCEEVIRELPEPDADLQALFEALVRRMADQAENIGKPRI